jgi:hypothetical protein
MRTKTMTPSQSTEIPTMAQAANRGYPCYVILQAKLDATAPFDLASRLFQSSKQTPLRLFHEHVAALVCFLDKPCMVSIKTGAVGIPSKPLVGHKLQHR